MLLGLELFPKEQRDTEMTSANSVFRIIFKCVSSHMLIHVTFHIITGTSVTDWSICGPRCRSLCAVTRILNFSQNKRTFPPKSNPKAFKLKEQKMSYLEIWDNLSFLEWHWRGWRTGRTLMDTKAGQEFVFNEITWSFILRNIINHWRSTFCHNTGFIY